MRHMDNNLFTGLLSLSYTLAQGIGTQLWHTIPLKGNRTVQWWLIKKYNFQVPHSDFLGSGDTFLKYAPKEADV